MAQKYSTQKPSTIDPESFGFLITDTARLVRAEFDRRIAARGGGLTAGEARTLSHAARAGAVRQTALAEQMGVEAMTLSGFLDRLEARGLIVRVTDPADRRAKLVELTDAANAVLAEITAIAKSVRDEAADGIEPAAWAAMMNGIKAARANLQRSRDAGSRVESDAA